MLLPPFKRKTMNKLIPEIVCTDDKTAKRLKKLLKDNGHDTVCLTMEEAKEKYGKDLPEAMGFDHLEVTMAYFNWFEEAGKRCYYPGSNYHRDFISAFISRRQLRPRK